MNELTRRTVLFGLVSLLVAPANALDSSQRIDQLHATVLKQDRWLDLYRPQTKERKRVCYWTVAGGFQKEGYLDAVYMLRDAEYGKQHYMDPNLLDVLFIIQAWLRQEGRPSEMHILSGYRTPEHNFRLEGAAKQSLHMQGKAADIYIPGLSTKVLAMMSRYVGAGGVGIYLDKNFIHVDTGNVRTWRG